MSKQSFTSEISPQKTSGEKQTQPCVGSDGKLLLKPALKPERPFFSSGPCVKPLSWRPEPFCPAFANRSHRSVFATAFIKTLLDDTRAILNLPEGYAIVHIPGSGTGAINALMYNLLGPRHVDLFSFEVFSRRWADEVADQLKLPHTRHEAAFGELPDLTQCSDDHDIVMVLNGTTSGVCVPNLDWISEKRQGLVICDAVSAIFATEIDWTKIDAMAFSWQKTLGAEAGIGTAILSPRALQRLEEYVPSWPLPYTVKLKGGEPFQKSLVVGGVISTPSMITFDEMAKALAWGRSCGGVPGLMDRVENNYQVIRSWVEQTTWCQFLVRDPSIRSHIAVTLSLAPMVTEKAAAWAACQKISDLLAGENAAFDIMNHSHAPPSLRIWCGPTVETEDLQRLCHWLDWAHTQIS